MPSFQIFLKVLTTAKSGTLSIYLQCSPLRNNFNATFQVLQCPYQCSSISSNRVCNEMNQCVCRQGFSGQDCQLEKCPDGCGGAGYCNNKTNLCECTKGFKGPTCSDKDHGKTQKQAHSIPFFSILPSKIYRALGPAQNPPRSNALKSNLIMA